MAVTVRRYNTARIARYRRFRALLDATKHRHQASIAANACNRLSLPWFFFSFFIVNLYKKGPGLMLRPLFVCVCVLTCSLVVKVFAMTGYQPMGQRPLFSIGVLHIKRKRRA
jgi:hypothetical protein